MARVVEQPDRSRRSLGARGERWRPLGRRAGDLGPRPRPARTALPRRREAGRWAAAQPQLDRTLVDRLPCQARLRLPMVAQRPPDPVAWSTADRPQRSRQRRAPPVVGGSGPKADALQSMDRTSGDTDPRPVSVGAQSELTGSGPLRADPAVCHRHDQVLRRRASAC